MSQVRQGAILLVAICAATVFACSRRASDKIGFGTLQDGIYTNEYFGMTAAVPAGWYALDDTTRKAMMQQGMKIAAGDNKTLQSLMDAAEMQSVSLFAVYRYPPGSPVPFNHNTMCVAEKVGMLPGIKRGSDYLYSMKKLMSMSQAAPTYKDDIYSEEIGGVPFDIQKAEVAVGTMLIQQKYYAAIMKGYALAFVTSSTTEDEEAEIKGFLSNIQFRQQ